MHRLRRQDAGLRSVLSVAQQLHRLRLLLSAAEQGPGLPLLRQGLQALGSEGDDAVRPMQKVSRLHFFLPPLNLELRINRY